MKPHTVVFVDDEGDPFDVCVVIAAGPKEAESRARRWFCRKYEVTHLEVNDAFSVHVIGHQPIRIRGNT